MWNWVITKLVMPLDLTTKFLEKNMKNVFPAVLREGGPPSQATILNEIPLCVQSFFLSPQSPFYKH